MAAITIPSTAITTGAIPTPFPSAAAFARRPRSRRLPAAVYWRRRAVVLVTVVSAAFAGHAALAVLGGGPLTAAEVPSPKVVALSVTPVSKATYVVQSGDTLWTIARHLQPAGDVRPLVDQLAAGRHGRPLQVGERIVLP